MTLNMRTLIASLSRLASAAVSPPVSKNKENIFTADDYLFLFFYFLFLQQVRTEDEKERRGPGPND